MTKQEFLDRLEKSLSGLSENEISERLGFYAEMIDDRIEEGLPEEEAVSAVGYVDEIATQIKEELSGGGSSRKKSGESKKLKGWEAVLIFAGLPLWLSLLITAFAVIISLYAAVWSVVVSLWAIFGALVGGALGGLVSGIMNIIFGNAFSGALLLGAALVCAGLSILMFFGCRETTKAVIKLTKRIFAGKKRREDNEKID